MLALGSIPLVAAIGHVTLAQLYVVTIVAGVLTVFFDVAYQSYLPTLVGLDHIVEGNAKLTGTAQLAQAAGPSIAGILVQAAGGFNAVAVDAGSFAFSGLAISAIRTKEPAPISDGGRSLRKEIHEGLIFVFGHPILRAIAGTTATANLFNGIQTAVEIVFLVRVVHASPALVGVVFSAGALGGLLAAMVASKISRRIGGVRATFAGILFGVGALLLPLTTPGVGLILFGAGFFLNSFGAVLYNINQVSFRQRLCPERLLGRMNATMRFVVWGVLPIGALLGGVIGSSIGTRNTLWIAGGGGLLAVGWLLASPMRTMRDFPSYKETDAESDEL
jgi:hypothetical protein